MTVEKDKCVERKNVVVVGIKIDKQSRELLDWALVKVAEPGDCVIAVHICRSPVHASKEKPLLEDYLEDYEGLCNVKKVDLVSEILTGSSVRKILLWEAKNQAAVALVVGITKTSSIGAWVSTARYCAKRLPPTTDVLAIHHGKVVFRRSTKNQLPGVKQDPKPSLNIPMVNDDHSEYGDSKEIEKSVCCEVDQKSQDGLRQSTGELSVAVINVFKKHRKGLSDSTTLFTGRLEQKSLGWPLLLGASSAVSQTPHARSLSVVQWVMSFPDRSPQLSPQYSTIKESPLEGGISETQDESCKISSFESSELDGLEGILKLKSSNWKLFSHDDLKTWTSQFSSGNLIGKGGCNRVYKGVLPDGKQVAVKVLRPSKEGWKDFVYEVKIISTLKHKNITPLLGICIKDNALISVYDFFPKGSLEENLHGRNKDESMLSWNMRFNVAVGIAEALNYLHNELPNPVIHRDVKSSNILLSNQFEPQLSDFGLAIWGPTTSSFLTREDVLGTFGYLAPEYFMYGKVSDKIDVYAFGVVLLELISGRKPIGCDSPKGQESLVMWAKPIIEGGNFKDILDPCLDGKFDEVQMQRIVLAATLCIGRAARLRPKMSQILRILKGYYDVEKFPNSQGDNLEDSQNSGIIDDEVYPSSSTESHLSLALLDAGDDTPSYSSSEQINSVSWEEYLKQRWSRSSSFN